MFPWDDSIETVRNLVSSDDDIHRVKTILQVFKNAQIHVTDQDLTHKDYTHLLLLSTLYIKRNIFTIVLHILV